MQALCLAYAFRQVMKAGHSRGSTAKLCKARMEWCTCLTTVIRLQVAPCSHVQALLERGAALSSIMQATDILSSELAWPRAAAQSWTATCMHSHGGLGTQAPQNDLLIKWTHASCSKIGKSRRGARESCASLPVSETLLCKRLPTCRSFQAYKIISALPCATNSCCVW